MEMLLKSYSSTIQDIDEKGVIVKAVNAFGNKDAVGDISLKGSYTKTLSEGFGRVRWFLNHKRDQLLGVPIEGHQTESHLVMKSKINLNKQIGRDTYEDYKIYAEQGKSLEHSVGVIAVKGKYEIKGDTRLVSEWRLMEYSTLTDWGANPNTPTLSIKSEFGEGVDETIAFLEICLKKANYSDIKGKQVESQIAALKALIAEPSIDTLIPEPPAAIDYKSIIQSFKIS